MKQLDKGDTAWLPEAELPALLAFFDNKLDRDKMLQIVKPELYRNRA